MATRGPLANLDTKLAALDNDINRVLYMGKGKALRFIIVDTSQQSGYQTLLVIVKGFDRVSDKERTRGDGSEVIFDIADLGYSPTLYEVLTTSDLHVEIDGDIYKVSTVPPVANNEAQVYRITCKQRTLRKTYFDNSQRR